MQNCRETVVISSELGKPDNVTDLKNIELCVSTTTTKQFKFHFIRLFMLCINNIKILIALSSKIHLQLPLSSKTIFNIDCSTS